MAKGSGGTRTSRPASNTQKSGGNTIFSNERLSDFVERKTEMNLANGYVLKSTPIVTQNKGNVVGVSTTREYYVELTKGNKTIAWQTATLDDKSQLVNAMKEWHRKYKLQS